jgi:hypothetical protein
MCASLGLLTTFTGLAFDRTWRPTAEGLSLYSRSTLLSMNYEQRLVEAHRVITALHMAGFAGAVVSGGYLRDTRLGIEPKDMDVFITNAPGLSTEQLRANVQAALGLPTRVQFDIPEYVGFEVERILDVMVDGGFGVPIQVIELATGLSPNTRAAINDFGLCQVWMDISGIAQETAEFTRDLAQKTFTLLSAPDESQHRRSLRRWERLEPKLAPLGFRFVDASVFAPEDEGI